MSNAFRDRGHETFTVDWSSDFDVDLHIDVNNLTAENVLERFGEPDVIWLSPDCSTFSVAAISRIDARIKKPATLIQYHRMHDFVMK